MNAEVVERPAQMGGSWGETWVVVGSRLLGGWSAWGRGRGREGEGQLGARVGGMRWQRGDGPQGGGRDAAMGVGGAATAPRLVASMGAALAYGASAGARAHPVKVDDARARQARWRPWDGCRDLPGRGASGLRAAVGPRHGWGTVGCAGGRSWAQGGRLGRLAVQTCAPATALSTSVRF